MPPAYDVPVPASGPRRWAARLLDTVFVLLTVAAVAVPALLASDSGALSIDVALAVSLGAYPVALILFGGLYGRRLSPGQALMGVVSVNQVTWRRVGFWRGVGRYLGVGLFPIAIVWVVLTFFETPTMDHRASITVIRR